MAGRSRGQIFSLAIAERGGVEWIAEERAKGRSLRDIAREIGCGRWWLDRFLYANTRRDVSSLAIAAWREAVDDLA